MEDRILLWRERSETNDKGCWLWTGALDHQGYGLVYSVPGGGGKLRKRRLHIISFTYFSGKVPAGLELDHLCRVRNCWNPDHLEAVPHHVNTLRGEKASRTHCKFGHLFDEKNTFWRPSGGRRCRACERARSMRRWLAGTIHKKKETK